MFKKICAAAAISSSLLCLGTAFAAGEVNRTIPHPLPSHPGNIFLAGESVEVPLPAGSNTPWHAVDYDGKIVATGQIENGRATLGKLPVGYYEVTQGDVSNRVTVGVLETLRAPTPTDSPIGIDVALSWCFPKEQWDSALNFCQLAGMNRVRDRLMWIELEPKRGEFVANSKYDDALKVQNAAGLQVLQVNHVSAAWATTNDIRRFPPDLRDIYQSYREVARRWRGQIVAFEPWNEADIKEFGGHTGNEMASLQKAAYLGLKAGNPDLPVCMNVFAIRRQTTLRNFQDNQAWAYFDNFDIHHYEPLTNYPRMYEDFRAVSAGKPIWVTECNVTVDWAGDAQKKEPTDENLRIQSERVVKVYTQSIHEGARAVFFFMLPHYTERQLQYGLLHADLTPRPAFMSAAVTGRLLAGAQRLGQVEAADKRVHGYLFAAKPDGQATEVLVIWAEDEGEYEMPKPPAACFDHLGRECKITGKSLTLTRAPLFVLLPRNSRPAVMPLPPLAPLLKGRPDQIVLQAVMPQTNVALMKSAYKMEVGTSNTVPIFLYNFGATNVHGRLEVTAPDSWTREFPKEIDIAPGERKELPLKLAAPKAWDMAARVQIKGDFGSGGQSLLALRFVATTNQP